MRFNSIKNDDESEHFACDCSYSNTDVSVDESNYKEYRLWTVLFDYRSTSQAHWHG